MTAPAGSAGQLIIQSCSNFLKTRKQRSATEEASHKHSSGHRRVTAEPVAAWNGTLLPAIVERFEIWMPPKRHGVAIRVKQWPLIVWLSCGARRVTVLNRPAAPSVGLPLGQGRGRAAGTLQGDWALLLGGSGIRLADQEHGGFRRGLVWPPKELLPQ